MAQVYSKAIDQYIEVERLIGHHNDKQPGPTLIFICGIHGNEPAGVFALKKVLEELQEKKIKVQGSVYAIGGNLSALEKGIRYQKKDLNRLWTKEKIISLLANETEGPHGDTKEQLSIYRMIKQILHAEEGPFYFLDLHTTSSKTNPFLTVNDSLLNRKFTKQYPSPIILGIEEYLDGALLSYINELGYVSFGFEGGQHNDPVSVDNHISFTYLTMVFAGSVDKTVIDYGLHYNRLANSLEKTDQVYEIFWQYTIKQGEVFHMSPGFINFQKITKSQKLATSNGRTILATNKGRIFMPLYQNQGDDGFFVIRKVPIFFLQVSSILRKIRFDHILPILPGIHWLSDTKDELGINLKIARFFTKQFFHLIGYRSRQMNETHLRVKNREAASRKKEYENAIWNQ